MQIAPIPQNEIERMRAVKTLGILDTKKEARFDQITAEAAQKLNTPISTISIIDEGREWYKACYGIDTHEGKRDISFCGHTLVEPEDIMVIEDTLLDERFADNPYVISEPFIRFYAGVRLFDLKSRLPVGVFCVKDKIPRKLSVDELAIVLEYAAKAEEEINKE